MTLVGERDHPGNAPRSCGRLSSCVDRLLEDAYSHTKKKCVVRECVIK